MALVNCQDTGVGPKTTRLKLVRMDSTEKEIGLTSTGETNTVTCLNKI